MPHVPVWFMRQAGRSLPEYRALRGTGSILETIGDPEVACEATLQPVRRYGVDAAILFSDIVVPLHAIGFGVDVVPGRGPVVEHPVRTRPTSTGSARSRRTTSPTSPRRSRLVVAELRRRDAAHRVRRRALHRRELPRRGRPDEDLRGREGARARASRRCSRALTDRLADLAIDFATRPGAARARRRSSCSTRGRARSRPTSTSASRCPPTREGARRARAARGAAHPLRPRHRRAARR